MYGGNYGYPNNAAAGSPPYNGGAPPPGSQNSVMQPGSAPNQMMYNHQQYPMGPQSFPGNPNMMPGGGGGPTGMMQNGMPHMAAANGQMPNYQPPYSGSPYGAGVPSSVPPQMNMPPNYGMGGGMPMAGYPMQGMNPQQPQMMQRMQASQANPNPNMQRNFPNQPPQGTPTPTPSNGQAPQQPQVSGPQTTQPSQASQLGASTPQQQTPVQAPPSSNNIQTPQTPTFPSATQGTSTNGTSSGSTPMSPGADSKEKERVNVLLDINNELLCESIQIQATQDILKKEREASNGIGSVHDGDKKSADEEQLAQDYIQCMRRLQTNLTYLAALVDKKPQAQVPPCPAYLKAPPLSTHIKMRQAPTADGVEHKMEPTDREETVRYLEGLYTQLQGLYPGIDPNKEPAFRMTGGPGRAGAQGGTNSTPGTQTPGHTSPTPGQQPTPTMANSAPPTSGAPSMMPV
ncbi:hypothetical protein GGR57DRAFT_247964 [Xylariaceae sp. FL1272]|nr:hypothetical protein GGR57DRAFT_247964 [Xylariaceae sp. FL1272]